VILTVIFIMSLVKIKVLFFVIVRWLVTMAIVSTSLSMILVRGVKVVARLIRIVFRRVPVVE
jgi:hypothetical protein